MPEDYLAHHGILGQKWGRRRYQNEDGTRTSLGKRHERDLYEDSQESNNSTSDNRVSDSYSTNKSSRSTSDKVKTGLKIAAGVAVAAGTAYALHKTGLDKKALDVAKGVVRKNSYKSISTLTGEASPATKAILEANKSAKMSQIKKTTQTLAKAAQATNAVKNATQSSKEVIANGTSNAIKTPPSISKSTGRVIKGGKIQSKATKVIMDANKAVKMSSVQTSKGLQSSKQLDNLTSQFMKTSMSMIAQMV